MKKIDTLELAYQELANACLDFIHSRKWDSVSCKSTIFSEMARTEIFLTDQGRIDKNGVDWPNSAINPGDAALFLRDDFLRRTGERIWGLNFTLFPDGKFDVEFDYSKPTDYEESDESISGIEINQSLQELRPDSDKN
ncbi:hypothetical protein [Herbaspirillum huttiense]|uniref:hypothetical protein n=1 Tax=Herbaspirillum huttiense TaxID=863372 RepID=UPI0039AF792D